MEVRGSRRGVAAGAAALCLAFAAALALATGAAALFQGVKPHTGPYQGVIENTPVDMCSGNQTEGLFGVKKNKQDVRKIFPVTNAAYCGNRVTLAKIRFPSSFDCNAFPLDIPDSKLKIGDRTASLTWRGTLRIGPHHRKRTVRVTAQWFDARTAYGATWIKSKSGLCDTGKLTWEMNNPPIG